MFFTILACFAMGAPVGLANVAGFVAETESETESTQVTTTFQRSQTKAPRIKVRARRVGVFHPHYALPASFPVPTSSYFPSSELSARSRPLRC